MIFKLLTDYLDFHLFEKYIDFQEPIQTIVKTIPVVQLNKKRTSGYTLYTKISPTSTVVIQSLINSSYSTSIDIQITKPSLSELKEGFIDILIKYYKLWRSINPRNTNKISKEELTDEINKFYKGLTNLKTHKKEFNDKWHEVHEVLNKRTQLKT